MAEHHSLNNTQSSSQQEPDWNSVPKKKAPWLLKGNAYVTVYYWPKQAHQANNFLPAELRDPNLEAKRSPFAFLAYVDYASSDVGPYKELLFIPGLLPIQNRRYPTISPIWVSTWDSVVNGNINWGIPKNRADFEHKQRGKADSVMLSYQGVPFAEVSAKHFGFGVPFNLKMIPERWRALAQIQDGQTYFYSPLAKGKLYFARTHIKTLENSLFPELTKARALSSFYIKDFEMCFPTAIINSN